MGRIATSQGIQIVHFVPGRIRIKSDQVKGNESLAREIEAKLAGIDGIHQVSVSPVTGSIVVHFDPTIREEAWAPLLVWAETAGLTSSGGVDVAQLGNLMEVIKNDPAQHSAALTGETRLNSLNASVTRMTGGTGEFGQFLPLTVVFLGLKGLLRAANVAVPAWYNYAWLGITILSALRPRTHQRQAQA